MNYTEKNSINGYNIKQIKDSLPLIIRCSTRYKDLIKISQIEYYKQVEDSIIGTIKRIRRYQDKSIIDLAKFVKLLYEIKESDSIQIKLNGKTQLDFYYGGTTKLLFETLNHKLAISYTPQKMMQFYKFLYNELLWEEHIKSPVDNNDTKTCLFEYSASKNYKRITEFEHDDDIDIRLYFGHIFKDDVTPYYAKNSKGESIQPIGFTIKGIKTIIAIESTLQKRVDSHYIGAFLYTLGSEFQHAGIFDIKSRWFTNEQYAFLYDIIGVLGLLDKDFNLEYSNKEKQTFVKKEMIKYNKYMK